MKIKAYVYFLKEVIRIDYEYNGKMTYNESNDTNRLDILSQQSISCFSDIPKEKEAFSFFVFNCFEILINENGVVSGKKAYDKLKEMQSETICYHGDSISVKVKAHDAIKEITQEELQLIIVDYILDYLRKSITYSCLIYGSSLDENAIQNIKRLFMQRNQRVECIPFSEFVKETDQPAANNSQNQQYFRSVRMNSNDQEDMEQYYEKNIRLIDLDDGRNKFSSYALFCRTGDSQYVSLLEDVNVTKVYFPLCFSDGDVINLNIYVKDVMKRTKFVGGIRALYKRTSTLPHIVLLVRCKQFSQYKVFRLILLDIERHTEKSFLFGDWENTVNSVEWDYSYPILENNPFFSFIPCVDRVEIQNVSCSIYGRIFDLEGKMFYKGEFDSLSSINMLSNSTIILNKPFLPEDSSAQWSVLLSNPQSQSDNDMVVLQHNTKSTIYVGYQLNGQPHGQGYVVDSCGHIVQLGEFANGMFVKGDWFCTLNGQHCILSGSFAKDVPIGKFTAIHRSTNMPYIEGEMKENGECEGTLYKYNRTVFVGTFCDFKPARGTLFYLNGTKKYEGSLCCDKPEGRGTFYFYEDSLSIFELRKRLQQNTLVPRKYYEGEFKSGVFNGQGTLYSSVSQDLVLYKGAFQGGLFHGHGSYAVSPIAVLTDNSFTYDWSRENLLNQWESHASSHTIIAFIGFFENNLPQRGRVYFNDGAYADVTRDGNRLVSDTIRNHIKCYRILGKFEIVDWNLKFLGPISHCTRPSDVKQYQTLRKGYFDEKTKKISEYVLETDLINPSNKGIKHYEVILDPKSWMWHFGKELEINDSDEGYVYALNLVKYSFCSINGTSTVILGLSFCTYDVAFYCSGCIFLFCLSVFHSRDHCAGNKET